MIDKYELTLQKQLKGEYIETKKTYTVDEVSEIVSAYVEREKAKFALSALEKQIAETQKKIDEKERLLADVEKRERENRYNLPMFE